MIYFKKIRWKNFLSTGNSFTELDFTKNNTTLVVGENGAGKSTMLDALSFVLYNKPFRKINKPQLINTINKKDLTVEVEFDVGTHKYKVIRGLKPTVFEIYQNGNMLGQDAASKDYQEVLEKFILKLNHKSFCQVVVLGSASFVPFMQLAAASRREVIEDLLDIQIFSTMNSLLKEKVNTNTNTLQQVEYDANLISEKIKMQNQLIVAMQRNNQEQIEKLKGELNELTARIDTEKQAAVEIQAAIDELQKQTEDQESINKRHKKIQTLETLLSQKVSSLKSEIDFFGTHDDCPTCKQSIDRDFKCQTIDSKQHQLQETLEGITKLEEELALVTSRIQDLSRISSAITSMNIDKITHNNNINGLLDRCKKVANEIKQLQQKNEEYAINDDAMKELEHNLGSLVESKKDLLNDRDALGVASIILKDNGIKSKIIKQYVPVINKLINKYLAAMDFFVNFELNENFDESIKSRFRDEFSYASFSEGEKMRINLAILFTWRAIAKLRNSASTNLLIMDEVLDGSLDSNGTDEFLKIIGTLTQDTNTFIISHKVDQLVDKFANVIKFEKHKNFSRMIQ